jgi:hypothetical protein
MTQSRHFPCQAHITPLFAEPRRRIAGDGLSMAEPNCIERETGKLAPAGTTFIQTLEAEGITEADSSK